jgi:hypothetical protein
MRIVGYTGITGQRIAIDAAVAASVKRFIPSGFGADLGNSKVKQLPVFGDKIPINDYVEEKAAENPDFSYTHVQNGVFLDWGLGTSSTESYPYFPMISRAYQVVHALCHTALRNLWTELLQMFVVPLSVLESAHQGQ